MKRWPSYNFRFISIVYFEPSLNMLIFFLVWASFYAHVMPIFLPQNLVVRISREQRHLKSQLLPNRPYNYIFLSFFAYITQFTFKVLKLPIQLREGSSGPEGSESCNWLSPTRWLWLSVLIPCTWWKGCWFYFYTEHPCFSVVLIAEQQATTCIIPSLINSCRTPQTAN